MITSIFKNNIFSYSLVFILGIVLWGMEYFKQDLSVPISLDFVNQTFEINRSIGFLISFVLIISGGLYLNYKLKKYLFSYDPTNLFILFYVLFSSFGLSSTSFLTYSLISFLLVLLVNYFLYYNEKKSNENQIFNSAFIIGVLIFQNFLFVLLVPLLVINLRAVKRIELKEYLLISVGFILPSFLIVMMTLLTSNIDVIFEIMVYNWNLFYLPWEFALYFICLIIISVKGYRLVMTKRSGVDITIFRLTKSLFMFFIFQVVISSLSLFLFEMSYFTFVIAIPLSIFLSDFFSNTSHKMREIVFIGVLVCAFLIRM